MIQAMTLLHQRQRNVDVVGRLVATIDDYAHARQLLSRPIGRAVGRGMSDGALRFFERLQSRFPNGERFTTRDAEHDDEGSERSVRGWLTELCGAGSVEVIEPHRGPKPAVWVLTDDIPEHVDILPSVSDVFPDSACQLAR